MTDLPTPAKPSRAKSVVRIVGLVVALVLCVAFLVPRAGDIADAFTRQDPWTLVAALLTGAAATFVTFLSWRALMHGAGHRIPFRAAQRVFFLSQIGKYVPGSVWPIVAQADLGREHRVPAAQSVAVGMLTLLVSCGAGVSVAALTIPFVQPDAFAHYWFVVLLVPVVLAALHPAVLRFGLRLASRVTRRDLGTIELRTAAVVRAFGWAVLAWVVFGLHIALVLVPLASVDLRVTTLTVGAYALAWLVGFLVFFLPAGLGGREAVLTALLAAGVPLGSSASVSVAVTSRVLLTVVDVVFAGAAVVGERRRRAGIDAGSASVGSGEGPTP
ncbi:lysylphosphatidylglycerol synthase domain-containing protein [uncultured Curtobacterium sp.]|uniref:lysylphosphatidylglycerol synthase domain-containing protein n=1 Tax=uncultured Curtobacterium sp. TaxID=331964 RepID=UPI002584E13E|nr:lysylphosphatidylglycerol synthase domain-containing protein [uncultured Curtobacterium sp.]